MKHGNRLFAVIATTALLALSLGPASAEDVKPFVRAIAADVNSMDPHDTRGAVDQDFMLNVYEKLVEMEFHERDDGALIGDPTGVVPDLAESWTVDGPAITFKLRKDVKFYPTGNPMTADDVVYSFSRMVSIPANGKNQAGVAGLYTPDQVEKLDDYTVKVTFMDGPKGKPTEIWVRETSMKFLQFGILDSVEVKKHATADDPWARDWLQKNVAGTGPYYVSEHVPNQQITLSAVPNRAWGPQPFFKDVILRITGDADVVSLLKGGAVDYAADGLTGRQFNALEDAGFPVLHADTPNILKLSMAVDKPPLDNKLLRQAILYAVPIDQILKTAMGGRGKRQACIFNPDDPTCNDSFAKYTYDLDKAKELVKESGVKDIAFDFWYSNGLAYNNDIAILIKNSLQKIGMTVNLKPTPEVQLRTAVRARTFRENETMGGMLLHEATFWLPDPVTLTNSSLVSWSDAGGSGNWSRFDNPRIDELHYKWRNSTDVEGRTKAYQEIQDILADAAANNSPLILIGRTVASSKRIIGVNFSQEPYSRYAYIKLKD